ncbi:hypothetical protein KCU87_g499, partial [Aureobasidium melanogenum]
LVVALLVLCFDCCDACFILMLGNLVLEFNNLILNASCSRSLRSSISLARAASSLVDFPASSRCCSICLLRIAVWVSRSWWRENKRSTLDVKASVLKGSDVVLSSSSSSESTSLLAAADSLEDMIPQRPSMTASCCADFSAGLWRWLYTLVARKEGEQLIVDTLQPFLDKTMICGKNTVLQLLELAVDADRRLVVFRSCVDIVQLAVVDDGLAFRDIAVDALIVVADVRQRVWREMVGRFGLALKPALNVLSAVFKTNQNLNQLFNLLLALSKFIASLANAVALDTGRTKSSVSQQALSTALRETALLRVQTVQGASGLADFALESKFATCSLDTGIEFCLLFLQGVDLLDSQDVESRHWRKSTLVLLQHGHSLPVCVGVAWRARIEE